MALSTITWNSFLNGIQRKQSETVQGWINRWVFDHNGAALIGKRGNNGLAAGPLEHKQPDLFLITTGKWQTTVH